MNKGNERNPSAQNRCPHCADLFYRCCEAPKPEAQPARRYFAIKRKRNEMPYAMADEIAQLLSEFVNGTTLIVFEVTPEVFAAYKSLPGSVHV